MAKQNLSEQLDLHVEALITRQETAPRKRQAKANPQLQALARIAAELLDLPRQDFKNRLKSNLTRRTPMGSKPAMKAETRQTATAYLTVNDAPAAIEFYKKAFGATEVMRLVGPGTKIGHAEIRIGNSAIYLSDEFPEYGAVAPQTTGSSPVKMDLRVDDVDSFATHAVAAGAKEVR